MRRLIFVTHADVFIDPAVPVPDWRLNAQGIARHTAHATRLSGVDAIFCSCEAKARDAANIYAAALHAPVREIAQLGENDRSSTGYLPAPEFERLADAFFAHPEDSIQGWERAVDAQARVLHALNGITDTDVAGDILVVAHGAVGALFRAYLLGAAIDRTHDQPPTHGGNVLRVQLPDWKFLSGWTNIDIDATGTA